MEDQQHPSHEPDAAKGVSETTPNGEADPGAAPPPRPSNVRAGEPAPPAEQPLPESEPGVRSDVIMSKLPRSRPQHVSNRRRREQVREATQAARRRAAKTQEGPSATAKRRTSDQGTPAKRTAAARRAATGAKARPATPARAKQPTVSQRSRATTASARRPAPAATAHRSAAEAPSLSRLAVDGAVEAAKLPWRVGGRLTLRALDAVARGLRGP